MRVYQCDSCNKVISDPYTVKMKEFYVGVMDIDCSSGIVIPIGSKRKIKIHLCDECYKGLNLIGELLPKKPKKEDSEKQTMIEKELKIREACGYYALDIPNYNGSNFTLLFNSKRNAETVKHIIEVDSSNSNNATVCEMEEIKHGKWETIIDPYGKIEGWLHEECGRQVTSKDNFCPECGAKMDLEE